MKMMYGRTANANDDHVYMSGKSFPINSRKGSQKTQEQAGIYFCKETKEETQNTKTIFLSGKNTYIIIKSLLKGETVSLSMALDS